MAGKALRRDANVAEKAGMLEGRPVYLNTVIGAEELVLPKISVTTA